MFYDMVRVRRRPGFHFYLQKNVFVCYTYVYILRTYKIYYALFRRRDSRNASIYV